MKIQLLVLPLLALMPLRAQAQISALPKAPTAPKAASATMETAAAALLSRATTTYKEAKGVSLSVITSVNDKEVGLSNVRFSRPNMLFVEQKSGPNTQRLLLSGNDFYIVQGAVYKKQPAPTAGGVPINGAQLVESMGGGAGSLLSAMLDGKNPIKTMLDVYAAPPFVDFQGRTVALPARIIDGDVLSGVQTTFSFKVPTRDGSLSTFGNQMTAWFGGSPLTLRRIQSRYTQNGKTATLSEKIIDQKLNPTFAADTFKFNDTGLKPVPAVSTSSP